MASIYTVSQANDYIANMFAQDYMLKRIQVSGEVSNCKYHTSGHIYFTLKDSGGTLSAVMFRSNAAGLSFVIQNGDKLVVSGSIEVYKAGGSYSLHAAKIEKQGQGDLYEKYLKLKKELEEMGLFADEYKQPLPRYAQRIGIVTAKTGAAIKDIINISKRRNPYVQLILYPAIVQGERAVPSIIKGIKMLDSMNLDVIIVGRGGGSIEDLWAFNDENVARAIFAARTPIISAVGHETDYTIADFVADLRAPTPSAAAELATTDISKLENDLNNYIFRLRSGIYQKRDSLKSELKELSLRMELKSPSRRTKEINARLKELKLNMRYIIKNKYAESRHSFELLVQRLDALSPIRHISNGYAYISDIKGSKIGSIKDINVGDSINIRLSDGAAIADIKEIDNG